MSTAPAVISNEELGALLERLRAIRVGAYRPDDRAWRDEARAAQLALSDALAAIDALAAEVTAYRAQLEEMRAQLVRSQAIIPPPKHGQPLTLGPVTVGPFHE